ncbi:hypothetical protein EU528_10130 [Candidatus Thorarchaeota archaeon]|nr:MAG: hypothetical protein EU528_10130 [Candidatus Thorarchaeota archaeon]
MNNTFMEDFCEQMCNAIFTRQSNRQFLPERLSQVHETAILSFLDKLTVPFPHDASISFHKISQDAHVVYFKGPLQFIALESPKSVEDQAKLGFLGELIVLYAESLGVRTCWMGHYSKKQVSKIVYNDRLQESERQLFCIILLGYLPEKMGVLDRISKRRFSKKNRTIESFLHKDSQTDFPAFIRYALALSSKAPSAMNTQKWYYRVSIVENKYAVELGKNKGYKHFKWPYYDIDVGTAAAHIWLGLKVHNAIHSVTCSSDGHDSVWSFLVKDSGLSV